MENQICLITTAIYSEELDRCAYTVGQTMSGEWFFHWGAGIGAGENIPNELLQDPENIRGAYVGRKEEIRGEIEDCFDPDLWQGSEDQKEAAEMVAAVLLRGLE